MRIVATGCDRGGGTNRIVGTEGLHSHAVDFCSRLAFRLAVLVSGTRVFHLGESSIVALSRRACLRLQSRGGRNATGHELLGRLSSADATDVHSAKHFVTAARHGMCLDLYYSCVHIMSAHSGGCDAVHTCWGTARPVWSLDVGRKRNRGIPILWRLIPSILRPSNHDQSGIVQLRSGCKGG